EKVVPVRVPRGDLAAFGDALLVVQPVGEHRLVLCHETEWPAGPADRGALTLVAAAHGERRIHGLERRPRSSDQPVAPGLNAVEDRMIEDRCVDLTAQRRPEAQGQSSSGCTSANRSCSSLPMMVTSTKSPGLRPASKPSWI